MTYTNRIGSALLILALGLCGTTAFAQETHELGESTAEETRSPSRFGLHLQGGLLSPLGLGGVYASFAPTENLTIMAGAGLTSRPSSGPGWRASAGVAAHMSRGNHKFGGELWASVGPYESVFLFSEGPAWSLMPAIHLHLAYALRFAERFEWRAFVGAMSNLGVKPDNDVDCNGMCGPAIAPSTGMSLGVRF